tara:strand:- start:354 stop:2246 length:1893 start_codon:yes stop_codon:yes gene_type:complete
MSQENDLQFQLDDPNTIELPKVVFHEDAYENNWINKLNEDVETERRKKRELNAKINNKGRYKSPSTPVNKKSPSAPLKKIKSRQKKITVKELYKSLGEKPLSNKKITLDMLDKDVEPMMKPNTDYRYNPRGYGRAPIPVPSKAEQLAMLDSSDDEYSLQEMSLARQRYKNFRERKKGGKRRRTTRKKRGGDKYFDKHKKIIKEFLEHPEVAKKIKKHKKNKLSINQIMKKITRDKLNKIIKAYARYFKSQKGGKRPIQNNIEINRPTRPVITVPRPDLDQPPEGEEEAEINFFQILDGVIRLTEEQRQQERQNRNQQRRETRFNMVRHLLFSMFMLLSVFGLMVDGTNDDLTNRTGMNVLGQGIIMAHQTGLLGTAQRIMLWDVYWSFFNNAWIPGGFTGEDVVVHRQLARFIAPFFPLPDLRDEQEGGTANLCKVWQEQRDWEASKKTVTKGEADKYCKKFGDSNLTPNIRNLCSRNHENCWLGPAISSNLSGLAPRRRLVRSRNRTVAIDDQGFSSTQGGKRRRKTKSKHNKKMVRKRKRTRKRKSRRKRGSSFLGDAWGNYVTAPLVNTTRGLEYGLGQIVPGQLGSHMRGVGSKHYYHGQRGPILGGKSRRRRRRKKRKSRRRKRR